MIKHKELHGQLSSMIQRIDGQIQEAHQGLEDQRAIPTLWDLFTMVYKACDVMGWHFGGLDEIDIDFYVSHREWKNRYTVILGDPPECGVLFNHHYECTDILYYKK